jgi:hypothetical protein
MKVGVISDTHVPTIARALPPAVFDAFDKVDLIVHAGDIVELSVLEELKAIAPVEAVAGNMDGSEVHLLLPFKKVLSLGRFRVGLIHGKWKLDIQKEMIQKEFENVDIIVYGHSHEPFWGKIGSIWFLNPGSPTDTRYAPYNSVAILDLKAEPRARIVRI